MSQDVIWQNNNTLGVSEGILRGVNIVSAEYNDKDKAINLSFNKGLSFHSIPCTSFRVKSHNENQINTPTHTRPNRHPKRETHPVDRARQYKV